MPPSAAQSGSLSERRAALWIGLLFVIAAAVYASAVRFAQLSAWENHPSIYLASGVPMMTTLDAYYSLRLARLQASGAFVPHGPVPARHYSRPEQGEPGEWYDQREPQVLPLLSRMIASVSVLAAGNIDKTGLLLSPLLSSLFMIPLFLCCWRLGIPAAGLMGGLVATFCIEYYRRTSVGWVDTDALNLFFPWTASFLILMHDADQRRERLLLLSAATGAVLFAYHLWYPKPGLTVLYACALAAHLLLAGVSWRRGALCVAVLVVCANPAQLSGVLVNIEDFVHRYLSASSTQQTGVASAIRFPSVWPTITEVKALNRSDALRLIMERIDFSMLGLVAFLPFALWRWRRMAALGPPLLLGALALFSSRRFIPYLAPFVGIGWGLVIALLVKGMLGRKSVDRAAAAKTSSDGPTGARPRDMRSITAHPAVQTVIAYGCVTAVFFIWFAPISGRGYVPPPAVPALVFRDLQALGERLPANSRIWTWWDFGFAIVDTTGFGVYHDGAAQYTAQTNLIAASLVHTDQRAMHDLIGFVDREGNRGIQRVTSEASDFTDLMQRVAKAHAPRSDVPIYVLFTPDMLLKYPSIRYLGTPAGTDTSGLGSLGIRWLDCERVADEKLYCNGRTADFRTGALEGAWPSHEIGVPTTLARAVIVDGGRVVREKNYDSMSGLTVQIVAEAGELRAAYLLDEPAFRSNLNQMFVLGRFDANYFEEVYNHFPYTRAYRVIAATE